MSKQSAAIVITAFHRDIFAIAQTGHRAAETMLKKMRALIVSKYGATAPTYEQYRADRAALRSLATDKKLADDQWMRKPYCAALKAEYGALPEAQTPEAIAKRAQRAQQEAAAKAAGTAPKAGAPAGQTQDRAPSEAEQIEALVARIGLIKTLDACLRILEADNKTQGTAVHMRKMAAKVAEQLAAA